MYSHRVSRCSHLEHFGRRKSHLVFELVHNRQLFCRKLGAGPGVHFLECRTSDDSAFKLALSLWSGVRRLTLSKRFIADTAP